MKKKQKVLSSIAAFNKRGEKKEKISRGYKFQGAFQRAYSLIESDKTMSVKYKEELLDVCDCMSLGTGSHQKLMKKDIESLIRFSPYELISLVERINEIRNAFNNAQRMHNSTRIDEAEVSSPLWSSMVKEAVNDIIHGGVKSTNRQLEKTLIGDCIPPEILAKLYLA